LNLLESGEGPKAAFEHGNGPSGFFSAQHILFLYIESSSKKLKCHSSGCVACDVITLGDVAISRVTSPYRKENTALHRYKDQPVNGCLRK
jgi:hypothetical protein